MVLTRDRIEMWVTSEPRFEGAVEMLYFHGAVIAIDRDHLEQRAIAAAIPITHDRARRSH